MQDELEHLSENESAILQEELDSDYEPTEEEIEQYANYLGMDLEKDQKYMYIAQEGLKAPLPEEWKPCQNQHGQLYYMNFQTNEVSQQHPCDQYYRRRFQEEKIKDENKKQMKSNAPKGMNNNSQNYNDDRTNSSMNNGSILSGYGGAGAGAGKQLTINPNESFDKKNNSNLFSLGKSTAKFSDSSQQVEQMQIDDQFLKMIEQYENQQNDELDEKDEELSQAIKVQQQKLQQKIDEELIHLKNEIEQQQEEAQQKLRESQLLISQKIKTEQDRQVQDEIKLLEEEHDKDMQLIETSQEDWYQQQIQKYEQKLAEELESRQRDLKRQTDRLNDENRREDLIFKDQKALVRKTVDSEMKHIVADYELQFENLEKEIKNQTLEEKNTLKNKLKLEHQNLQSTLDSKIQSQLGNYQQIINKLATEAKNDYEQKQMDIKEQYSTKQFNFQKQETDTFKDQLNIEEEVERRDVVTKREHEINNEREEILINFQNRFMNLDAQVSQKYENEQQQLELNGTQKIEDIKQSLKRELQLSSKKISGNNSSLIEEEYEESVDDGTDKIDMLLEQKSLEIQIENLKVNLEQLQKENTQLGIERDQSQNELFQIFEVIEQRDSFNETEGFEEKLRRFKQLENEVRAKQGEINRLQERLQKVKSLNEQVKQEKKNNNQFQKIINAINDLKLALEKKQNQNISQSVDDFDQPAKDQYQQRPKRPTSSVSQKQRDWQIKILEENNRLSLIKNQFLEQKRHLEETQKTLVDEQSKLKSEFNQLNDSPDAEIKLPVLLKMKSALNEQIELVNLKIEAMREIENSYNTQMKLMGTIDRLFDSYQKKEKEFNNDTLDQLYQTYQTIHLDLDGSDPQGQEQKQQQQPPPLQNRSNSYEDDNDENKQKKPMTRPSVNGQNVYTKWNQILNEQMKLTIDDINIKKPSVSQFSTLQNNAHNDTFEPNSARIDQPGASASNTIDHSYGPGGASKKTSALDTLKHKYGNFSRFGAALQDVESKMVSIDHDSTLFKLKTNCINRSTRTQDFQHHISWLGDMKNQLNQHLSTNLIQNEVGWIPQTQNYMQR